MGAMDGVLDALLLGLAQNGEALLGYAREWEGDAAEKVVVQAVGTAYVRVLVPFLRRAVVQGVFGLTSDADALRKREDAQQVSGARLLSDTVRNWESWLSEASS